MICEIDGQRYAPFPRKDFDFRNGKIIPKNPTAKTRRQRVFRSNRIGTCSQCAEHKSNLAEARMRQSIANKLFPIPIMS
jgi:hypothetical protein